MQARLVTSALILAARNCFRPSYLKHIGHASMHWRWDNAPRSLKRTALSSLSPAQVELLLLQCPQVYGETPHVDLLALATLVRTRRPATAFEFGTFRGQMTMNIVMNAPDGARVFTLDIPQGDRGGLEGWDKSIDDSVIGQLYRGTPYAARITQLLSDSRSFDPSPYRGKMDFVFVDACHDYEFVRNDSEKGFEMLSHDGVIAWHDYSPAYPGVSRYLEEAARSRDVFWVEGTQVAFCRSR
jgi:hypothetical protein